MQFITASKQFNTALNHVPAPLFKKIFEYTGGKAELTISAVGFYKLFLNGKDVTKGFFAPYISNPDLVLYYDKYDLTSDLVVGSNVLCVLLGNGFGNSLDNDVWQFESAPYRAAPKFWAELTIDGVLSWQTDENFRFVNSPITFDDLRCGERYDATLEIDGVFTDTSLTGFSKSMLTSAPKGELRRCSANNVKAVQKVSPVAIIKTENSYVYDFGQNNAGLCLLSVNGKRGQKIDLIYCEMLDNNHADLRNVGFNVSKEGYVQHDVYVCKDGYQQYLPSFTYHGFRYCEVIGIDDNQATLDLLTFVVIHSDLPQTGKFSCDSSVVNAIQSCTLTSDTSNFVYFLTDCPQREKNGWTADAALSAEQVLYNFDAKSSLEEWLYNVIKSQRGDGALPGIVPTGGWGFDWGNGPAWDSALIELTWQLYRFYGDKDVVSNSFDAIVKYFEYIRSRLNSDGLVSIGLGDWCQTYTVWEGDFETPVEITDTLTVVDLLAKSADLADVIGKPDCKADFLQMRQGLLTAFRLKYARDGYLTQETQTSYAMALRCGVFDEADEKTAYLRLLSLISAQNDHFRVGVVGYRYLFDVLTVCGDAELCYKLITQSSFPSYGFWIEDGATTLRESFEQYDVENGRLVRKDGCPRIPSFNHHFWGYVSAWFYKYLAGINVVRSDFLEISPFFVKGVNDVSAVYSRCGKRVEVKWKRTSKSITLIVDNDGFYGNAVIGGRKFRLKTGKNIFEIENGGVK